ncbi:MAG: carbon-nitrogen family hydrolase [Firmicutes bacterium]|nr:carbon-nitrogen family hydrolase [Bacillota bacterium]
MERRITVSAIQMPVVAGDVRANIARAGRLLEEAARRRSGIALLPEMWNTGFAYGELDRLAKEAWEPTLDLLRDFATGAGMSVFGSIPEFRDGGVYNALVHVAPGGQITGTYRKIHLFPLTGEHLHFRAGRGLTLFETAAGPVGGLICYDLRFPEPARILATAGARMLLYAAQWPAARQRHWETLLAARAVENQCWVVAANTVGSWKGLTYAGGSRIIDPWGVVQDAAEGEEAVVTVTVSLEEADRIRAELPSLSDRRPDAYRLEDRPDHEG